MRKSALLLLTLGLCTWTSVQAQCIADAGNDTAICYNHGITVFHLSATTFGGVPPYTYAWSCDYFMGNGALHFTASDFLDDTTIAGPRIIDYPFSGHAGYLTFFLTVEDDVGNICHDSVRIGLSSFAYGLEEIGFFINEGDSVQLSNGCVGGGFSPVTPTWWPPDGLSDIHSHSPWASPDTTTFYSVSITDSIGCQSGGGTCFRVYVSPATDIPAVDSPFYLKAFPNPASGQLMLRHKGNRIDFVEAVNLSGKVFILRVVSGNTVETLVSISELSAGVYLIKPFSEGVLQGQIRIIVNP